MSAPGSGLVVRGLEVFSGEKDREVEIAGGIDFELAPGEAIAIVGESGSGKSLSVRAVLDLLPDRVQGRGDVVFEGRDLMSLSHRERRALRGSGLSLVMQDPFTMLNPLERIAAQLVIPLTDERGRALRGDAALAAARDRLAEVGIEDPSVAQRYPFQLSGGMRQRVGIAAAIAQGPRILIADEPTTALDVTTQREILDLLAGLRRTREMGLILITHDLRVAFSVCDRVYVLYAGTLVEVASPAKLRAAPGHPYSLGLQLADPPIDRRLAHLEGIAGTVPPPGVRPPGCPFAPRCAWAQPSCEVALPEFRTLSSGHVSRCARIDEIADDLIAHRREAAARSDSRAEADIAPGETLVQVRGLRKEFVAHGGRAGMVALDAVDLDLCAGDAVGLVGESGSGKTTLGRLLVGLELATAGSIEVAGVQLVGGRPKKADRERARGTVQMAFQDPYSSLNPARSIGATLREAARLGGRGKGDVDRSVGELLERVGLSDRYLKRRPSELSGGERQRVAIARALARRPRLLICDEVVSALDVSVQAQILGLLRDLRAETGLGYLFITHDLAVVRQVTDRAYVLQRGKVVEEGPTAQLLDSPRHPYTKELVASVPDGHATFRDVAR